MRLRLCHQKASTCCHLTSRCKVKLDEEMWFGRAKDTLLTLQEKRQAAVNTLPSLDGSSLSTEALENQQSQACNGATVLYVVISLRRNASTRM